MPKFQPKVYFDGEPKRVHLVLFEDAPPVDVDDCLPPTLKAADFDRDQFEQFWQFKLPLWVVDLGYMSKVQSGTKKHPASIFWSDHINLEKLGLVADGQLNTEQLKFIISLIGRYAEYRPQAGLLFELCKAGISHATIEEMIGKLADPDQLVFDFNRLPDMDKDIRNRIVGVANSSRKPKRLKKRRKM